MSTRDDVHRLVDQLDEAALPDAARQLAALTQRNRADADTEAAVAELRRRLVTTYHDLPLGAVDASVLAVAERTGGYDIATLDRRHFTVIRPAANKALTLHP